jgi:hypothetical protein
MRRGGHLLSPAARSRSSAAGTVEEPPKRKAAVAAIAVFDVEALTPPVAGRPDNTNEARTGAATSDPAAYRLCVVAQQMRSLIEKRADPSAPPPVRQRG